MCRCCSSLTSVTLWSVAFVVIDLATNILGQGLLPSEAETSRTSVRFSFQRVLDSFREFLPDNYRFNKSLAEFWLFCAVRFLILLIAFGLVLKNRNEGPKRVIGIVVPSNQVVRKLLRGRQKR